MWFGLLFVVLAVLLFVGKLQVSYTTNGGSLGMVPVLDGAVFPPIFATFGLVMFKFAERIGIEEWFYFAFWVIATLLAFWAIGYAGKLGERHDRL